MAGLSTPDRPGKQRGQKAVLAKGSRLAGTSGHAVHIFGFRAVPVRLLRSAVHRHVGPLRAPAVPAPVGTRPVPAKIAGHKDDSCENAKTGGDEKGLHEEVPDVWRPETHLAKAEHDEEKAAFHEEAEPAHGDKDRGRHARTAQKPFQEGPQGIAVQARLDGDKDEAPGGGEGVQASPAMASEIASRAVEAATSRRLAMVLTSTVQRAMSTTSFRRFRDSMAPRALLLPVLMD